MKQEPLRDIILSIKPYYANEIRLWRKRTEVRRVFTKKPINRVFLYETCPIQMITGYITVASIERATPQSIWLSNKVGSRKKSERLALTREELMAYCRGREEVVEIRIKSSFGFIKSLDPELLSPFNWVAPQSFRFLQAEESEYLDEYMARCGREYREFMEEVGKSRSRLSLGKTSSGRGVGFGDTSLRATEESKS